MHFLANFPSTRKRRLRQNQAIRTLIAEHRLLAKDLVLPVFVLDGENRKEPIKSMPDIYRISIDKLLAKIPKLLELNIKAIAPFPVINQSLKSEYAENAYDENNLIAKLIRLVKKQFPQMLIIADIALDPYTSHGQDGIINQNGEILNDQTIKILTMQALNYARAGADILAPSDMMDGRIGKIRTTLEENGFDKTKILAYSAKYASSFYGPFRDAVGSMQNLGKADKKTYQMDIANSDEALHEVALDISEGADMVMIKPGMPYLDIVSRVKRQFGYPTAVYQVSGEYSMIVSAAQNGYLDRKAIILESLLSFKRAGADFILTYFAQEAAEYLKEENV